MSEETQMGPLNSLKQLELIEKNITETEAQGGNTAVSDGISYSRQWDFGGFSNLQDRSHGGANGNAVFHLDSEL